MQTKEARRDADLDRQPIGGAGRGLGRQRLENRFSAPSARSSEGSAGGALGGYTNTAQGKVISAAFMDAFNQMVIALRNYKGADGGRARAWAAVAGSAWTARRHRRQTSAPPTGSPRQHQTRKK